VAVTLKKVSDEMSRTESVCGCARNSQYSSIQYNRAVNTASLVFGLAAFNRPAMHSRSATQKNGLEDLFTSVLSQFKKISRLWKPEI